MFVVNNYNMATKNAEKNERWLSQGKKDRSSDVSTIGFPSISTTSHEQTKRRILVQRHHQFPTRHTVPAPGHEYDYRRTPDLGRATPRKFHGQIRPCIPPDTIDMDSVRINDSPTYQRTKRRMKLDVGRCPTPMESDSVPSQPLPTSRSAWDGNITHRTTAGVVDDLQDTKCIEEDRFEFKPKHLPVNNKIYHDRSGRRLKASNAPMKYDVIVSDADIESISPTPDSPLNLTEHVIQYYFQRTVNKDRRIARWLVECDDKKKQNQLPAHLPDISASNRNCTITFEDL